MYRKHSFTYQAGLPSSFNVEAFAAGSFEGAGDTRRLQIEAKEYMASVKGPFNEERSTRLRTTEKGHLILDVVWQPDDEAQRQALGLEKMPTVRQSVFLDVTPSGGLDMAPFKNGDLNRLREALNLNADGVKWSFADFVGKAARIRVEHRPNATDPANPYQNVTAVTKA
jgi:hypothetical protein